MLLKNGFEQYSLICSDQELVLFETKEDDYFEFCSLSLLACIKFIMCLYYDKHKSVFSSQYVYSLALSFKDALISYELALVLQWLRYAVSET